MRLLSTSPSTKISIGSSVAVLIGTWLASACAESPRCEIQVLEEGTRWPVPLVEFRTTSNVRFLTDNSGRIAFDLPEFMEKETWFSITSPGYSVKPDGFGNQGVRLTPRPGERLTVEVVRTMIARRLGRLTGAGLFSESQQLGHETEWKESGVTGSDSVQNALHNGKLFWVWGDTNLPQYPLGRFHMTGAITSINALNRFEPPLRVVYDYFTDATSVPRSICKMDGSGPTWLSGCISLPDTEGKNRLVGTYVKIQPPLKAYRAGLAEWDDQTLQFKHHRTVWSESEEDLNKPENLPEGNAILWSDPVGQQWALFGDPFPHLKCPANFEAWSDSSTWESIVPQQKVPSRLSDQLIKPHRGAIAWSPFRKRWVTIFTQSFGESSPFGEIWYAEAESPFGPWKHAVKVLSHQNYTFYNPRLHPHLSASKPSIILFEGTYSRTFSKTETPTAKYDYNQILYRLDLDDPALVGGS